MTAGAKRPRNSACHLLGNESATQTRGVFICWRDDFMHKRYPKQHTDAEIRACQAKDHCRRNATFWILGSQLISSEAFWTSSKRYPSVMSVLAFCVYLSFSRIQSHRLQLECIMTGSFAGRGEGCFLESMLVVGDDVDVMNCV